METMLMQELDRLTDKVHELQDVKVRIRNQRNRLKDEMQESINELTSRADSIECEEREIRLAMARIRGLLQQYAENSF